jgi:hypothetical protein
MISARITFLDETMETKEFSNYLEMYDYIKLNGTDIQILEVDNIEGSNNNRPAFWCEKR